jgi:hypothetical protein
MTLWWIGNIVLLAVVIPVVLVLMFRVLRPALQIKKQAEGVAAVGTSISTHLDSVHDLVETQRLVGETNAGLGRYGAALDRIL